MCFAREFFNPIKISWKRGKGVEEVLGQTIYLVRILESNVVWNCGTQWKANLYQMTKSEEKLNNYENKQS